MALAQLTMLSLGLAASATAAGSARQAFLAPSASFFSAPARHYQQQQQQPSRRRSRSSAATVMSTTAAPVTDAAGGVETRMWKWKGYDIRYKVAGEVRCLGVVLYRGIVCVCSLHTYLRLWVISSPRRDVRISSSPWCSMPVDVCARNHCVHTRLPCLVSVGWRTSLCCPRYSYSSGDGHPLRFSAPRITRTASHA